MAMTKCPKCGVYLNDEDKMSGRCISCGESLKVEYPKMTKTTTNQEMYIKRNSVAKVIHGIGIAIIAIGFLVSIINATDSESISLFFTTVIISGITGILFIGMAEIIQLLEDIKNRLYKQGGNENG